MNPSLDCPLYFAAWLRPAPLVGLALCAGGFGLSAALMFADLFGTR